MGYAEALKAATLIIVSKKLDEIQRTLLALGANNLTPNNAVTFTPPPQPAPSPLAKNPCQHCGREGIYKSKPNQWNRTGSWYCRAHMALAGQIEADDKMDRSMNFHVPSAEPSIGPPVAPGASTLQEAMGMAEIVDEP